MPKAYRDDDQPKKNVFKSLDSTKKQKTLGFVIRRRDTTTSDATSSNASSSNAATSMRSTGTSSSSSSTIFTVGGKENNIRLCSDEENTSASSGGRGQGNDHRKPAAKRAPTKQAPSTSTATFASATNIPNRKRKITQSLIVKVKISDFTMKQDLGVGDTQPTTMAEIQAANWFAQGMLSLVKSSYGGIDRLLPFFYLQTPRGHWTLVVQKFVVGVIEPHLDALYDVAYADAMLELVGFCGEPAPPHNVGDDVGVDVGDDVGDDVGVDVGDD